MEELTNKLADLKLQIQHSRNLQEIDALLAEIRVKQDHLARVNDLKQANPMLGTRGVRLGILIPELTKMQVRAIFEAACHCVKQGINPQPEVMIPLVSHVNELDTQQRALESVAKEVVSEQGVNAPYKFGTMIEVPRTALTADDIAKTTQFFSFGANDLTQTVYGISRDDAEAGFLVTYLEQGILSKNPFATIDVSGVGKLMQLAVELGRKTRPDLEIGICGEHDGDSKTIHFCHGLGLNYVSCSPYRVPIARLAAAHAELQKSRKVKKGAESQTEKAEVVKS